MVTASSVAPDGELPAAGAPAPASPVDPLYIDRLVVRLAQSEDAVVIIHRDDGIAAATFRALIFRYARALDSLGVGRSSLVALFAPNCPDALAIRYATNLLGAAATFLSAPRSSVARAALIAQVKPDLLVIFPETAHFLPADVDARVAAVDADLSGASLRLDELAAAQSSGPVACLARSDDVAVIISSGGSTGVPKGSWRTFAAYSAMVGVPSPTDRRQLVNGHLAYLSEVLVDITLLGGGVVVLKDAYEAADTLATIESERITDLFLVEPQLFDMMDHRDVAHRDLSSLRTLTHIGASAPPTLRLRARARLGPVLVHTYGASEEGLVSVLSPAEYDPARPERFTSAGRILPRVEVRLRQDDGTLAGPGVVGGIEIRSPAMAQGYRNRPDLDAAAFGDGWYRSGDLGRLDGDGYLHVLGRAADMAWVDGRMVSPTLVEDTLCCTPTVRYAAVVVDHGNDRWVAAAVPWPGASLDEAECRRALAATYGETFNARLEIVPLESVPLTEQGKPDREAICRLSSSRPGQG